MHSTPQDGYTGSTPNAKEGYRRLVGQSVSRDCIDWSAPRRIIVADDADVSTREMGPKVAHTMGRRVWLAPVPPPAMGLPLRLLGKRAVYDKLFGEFLLDTRLAQKALGWTPTKSFDLAIEESLTQETRRANDG